MAEQFHDQGFEVLNIDGFGMKDDIEMTRIPLKAILEGALQICDPKADSLFISCTAIRAAAVAEELEALLGKPVVTSNQALAWHSLQLLANSNPILGLGSLFRLQLGGSPVSVSYTHLTLPTKA